MMNCKTKKYWKCCVLGMILNSISWWGSSSGSPSWLELKNTQTAPLQRGKPHPNEGTSWPWVATWNLWGEDSGGRVVCDPETKKVIWLSTLHFDPYWTRQAVREARSDQSAAHVSPLMDLCKNPNEDDGCRVNHAMERLIALSVPGGK